MISLPTNFVSDGTDIIDVRFKTYIAQITTPVKVSFGGMKYRQTMVLEIETRDGNIGIGETWVNYPQWAIYERSGAIKQGLIPLIVGKSAGDVRQLTDETFKALFPYGKQSGATGPIYSLICGLEMALLDLKGKRENKSLSELFGQPAKDVPVYASGLDTSSDINLIESLLKAGHTGFKFKCGFDFEQDITALKRFRTVLGDDIEMMIDANQAFTVEEALLFAQRVSDLKLSWFEEPIDCRNFKGMTYLKKHSPIRIAAGENWYGLKEFEYAIKHQCVDIVQPDVIKNLTLSDSFTLIKMASDANLSLAFHNFSSAIGLMGSAHLAASSGQENYVEIDATGSAITDSFINHPLTINNGRLTIPTHAGLGFSITMNSVNPQEIC